MPINLSSSGGSEWKLLEPKVSLDGLTTKTLTHDFSPYKRIRLVGTFDKDTGVADGTDLITLALNGTDFNGLYTYYLTGLADNSSITASLVSAGNYLTIGSSPLDPSATNFWSISEAIIFNNIADFGRYQILVRASFRWKPATAPMVRFYNISGTVETTTAITSLTIANVLGTAFGDKSHVYLYGNKNP